MTTLGTFLHQRQAMEQRLVLTPMMRQAIEMLLLNKIEIEQRIEQELAENPLLERQEELSELEQIEQLTALEPAAATENTPSSEKLDGQNNFELAAPELDENFQEYLRENEVRSEHEYYEDHNYENYVTAKTSLCDHLLLQLHLEKLDTLEIAIGEYVIGNIDPNGYLLQTDEEIATALQTPQGGVTKLVGIIQKFEPSGICARSLRECLLIQIDALPTSIDHENIRYMLEFHLEDIEKRNLVPIARALGLSLPQIEQLLNRLITDLEPKPGRKYNLDATNNIVPDILISKVENEYIILINDPTGRLRINTYYKDICQKDSTAATTKYLKEKLSSARWLIDSIEQRNQTMLKIAQAIVDVQHDFFEHGVKYLKPLTLKEVAAAIEMSESTVSRVTTNKYLQAPCGTYDLKYFFTRGLSSTEGQDVSSRIIKEMIQELISKENGLKPLSDQKISNALLANQKVRVSRRTVTKYREQMNILPSSKRKRYS